MKVVITCYKNSLASMPQNIFSKNIQIDLISLETNKIKLKNYTTDFKSPHKERIDIFDIVNVIANFNKILSSSDISMIKQFDNILKESYNLRSKFNLDDYKCLNDENTEIKENSEKRINEYSKLLNTCNLSLKELIEIIKKSNNFNSEIKNSSKNNVFNVTNHNKYNIFINNDNTDDSLDMSNQQVADEELSQDLSNNCKIDHHDKIKNLPPSKIFCVRKLDDYNDAYISPRKMKRFKTECLNKK